MLFCATRNFKHDPYELCIITDFVIKKLTKLRFYSLKSILQICENQIMNICLRQHYETGPPVTGDKITLDYITK